MAGRKPKTEQEFWNKIDRGGEDECWYWNCKAQSRGYGVLNYHSVRWYAHRLAYTLAKGSIPDGGLVLHHCGNTLCCNPKHLYVGTHKQNAVDRDGHQRTRRGEAHWYSKLTADQVLEMRRLYGKGARAGGWSQVELAKKFGVDQTHVSRIVRSRPAGGWEHLS